LNFSSSKTSNLCVKIWGRISWRGMRSSEHSTERGWTRTISHQPKSRIQESQSQRPPFFLHHQQQQPYHPPNLKLKTKNWIWCTSCYKKKKNKTLEIISKHPTLYSDNITSIWVCNLWVYCVCVREKGKGYLLSHYSVFAEWNGGVEVNNNTLKQNTGNYPNKCHFRQRSITSRLCTLWPKHHKRNKVKSKFTKKVQKQQTSGTDIQQK